jgi:hypothetical protein
VKLHFVARKSQGNSVHADWIGSLPEAKMRTFKRYVRELESSYLMLSIPLDEAIGFRKVGLREDSLKHILIIPGLVAHFTKHLEGMLRAMQQHTKKHGVKPSVAPLNPANFLGREGIKGARRSQLLSMVLISRRAQFLEKIRRLSGMVTHIGNDFRYAVEDLISAGAAAEPASHLEAVDTGHYDLNTCLRETIVLLKCFIRAIPDPELVDFQRTAATILSQPKTHTNLISQPQLNAF